MVLNLYTNLLEGQLGFPLIHVFFTIHSYLELHQRCYGAVDCVLESQSGQIEDYKICICLFFAKDAALRR